MDLSPVYHVLSLMARYLDVPKHIAFVMDGNRRYARNNNQETSSGHQAGYGALRQILEFCYNAGVKEVSVYAFSIENFKRSEQEVSDLMQIADERIRQIIDRHDLAEKHGVQVRILGNKSLLPAELQKTCARAEEMTKNNTNVRLNVCMPYTARDDITHAMFSIAQSDIEDQNITEKTIQDHLYTQGSAPLGLLVRTSGTNRLSDFFLWEITDSTKVAFVDELWPQFTPWTLFKLLLAE